MVLDDHEQWVKDHDTGARADLRSADLSGSTLCDCNWDGAKITFRGKTVVVRFEEIEDA